MDIVCDDHFCVGVLCQAHDFLVILGLHGIIMRLNFQIKVLANSFVFVHECYALFIVFLTGKMAGQASGSNNEIIGIFFGNIQKRNTRFRIETMQMPKRRQAIDSLTAKLIAGDQDKMPVFIIRIFYFPIGTFVSLDTVKEFYIRIFIL